MEEQKKEKKVTVSLFVSPSSFGYKQITTRATGVKTVKRPKYKTLRLHKEQIDILSNLLVQK